MSRTTEVANAATGVQVVVVLQPILWHRQGHGRLWSGSAVSS